MERSARGDPGSRKTRGRLWLAFLPVLSALVMALPAAAQADATWTGDSTSPGWSDPTNWTPPTNNPAGTLTFPALGTCSTCYTSKNDLTGISAAGVVFTNPSSPYRITGNSVTVGSGGISDTPGGGKGNVITAPLALSVGQTWTVGSSNGYNDLTLQGGVTGGATLTANLAHGALFVDSDMEVGPVTVTGSVATDKGLHIGPKPGSNPPYGSVNATDGQQVTINGATLTANPHSTVGPLTLNGGMLLLGTNPQNNGTTTLQVNGAAALSPSTTTSTFINDNGSTPGTDFSQLSASGNISLAGTLVIGQGNQGSNGSSCIALSPGDVATLVTASGGLSGTFSNAPEGATLTVAPSCQPTAPQVQIHYTSNSVTATVLGGSTATPTTTTLAAKPSPATTNQPVTLTATVTGSPAPSGTVEFSDSSNPIPGCTGVAVSGSGTATCTTSFDASSSPESLTAAFTPSGPGQAASSSPPQTLTVNRASSTTALAPSDTSPTTGSNVTYTATVTPSVAGATKVVGAVTFLDGGQAISSCDAQPLTAGSSSSKATCTVSYPSAGSHRITASYGGDGDFTGSSSPTVTVNVTGPPTTPTTTTLDTPNPSPAASNQPVTLTAIVTIEAGAPSGTVAFSANGNPIPGCSSAAVSGSGTATCTTSFDASTSPESLTAAFTPSPGSGQAASSSAAQTLIVIPSSGPDVGSPGPPSPAGGTQSPPTGASVSATTWRATHVVTRRATLNASITTDGAAVSWQFQYGRSRAYNKATPLRTVAAGRHAPLSVSWTLRHLSPNVRYHYRLVVRTRSASTGSVQKISGNDRTFRTRNTGRLLLPPDRLLVIGHTIGVPQNCQSSLRCYGRLSITTTARVGRHKRTGTVLCTTKGFRIRAHKRATVRARITRNCLALLKHSHDHRLAGKFSSRPRSGQQGLTRKITLAQTAAISRR